MPLSEEKNDINDAVESLVGVSSFLPFQGIIHSLKNYISGICTGAEYISLVTDSMRERNDIDPELSNDIDEIAHFSKGINRTAGEMTRMVMAILDKAVQDHSNCRQKIDLNQMIYDELLLVRAREEFRVGDKFDVDSEFHHGGICLHEHFCPETLLFKVVPHHISQVFNNLLFNALEALVKGNKGDIEVYTFCDKNSFGFEVRDSGPGISPESVNTIFDPYFSTKEKVSGDQSIKGGSGLGLFSSLNIVRQYGGDIEVIPNLNPGCSFKVILPLHLLDKSEGAG